MAAVLLRRTWPRSEATHLTVCLCQSSTQSGMHTLSISLELAGRGLGSVLGLRVERDGRARGCLMDGVHHHLEQRQTLRRKPEAPADHHAVIGCAFQRLFQHSAAGFVRCDHAGIALPAALLDLLDGKRDAGVDFVGAKARRKRRVRVVHGFRLLPNEQDTGHSLLSNGVVRGEQGSCPSIELCRATPGALLVVAGTKFTPYPGHPSPMLSLANPCQRQLHGMRTGTPRRTMVVWPRSEAPWSRMRSLVARPLCSRFDEKRDSDDANNHQGGTSDEHVTDMMSCGARSHGYLVVFSDDRSFVRIT